MGLITIIKGTDIFVRMWLEEDGESLLIELILSDLNLVLSKTEPYLVDEFEVEDKKKIVVIHFIAYYALWLLLFTILLVEDNCTCPGQLTHPFYPLTIGRNARKDAF